MPPSAPLPRPCLPPAAPCLPRPLPIPSRQGRKPSLPAKGRYRRAVGAACWCELVAESAEASRRAPAQTSPAKSNASAAAYGRFSPILKRIVHARPTRPNMGR
jgi:hypothetical protein